MTFKEYYNEIKCQQIDDLIVNLLDMVADLREQGLPVEFQNKAVVNVINEMYEEKRSNDRKCQHITHTP